ncbi:CPXCG motif-containing cysteine-rich protein [Pelagibaculum spongiae]|uniref:CPXCG motif-containing cysteine-rich protein n=1 Tax=Pelagibaculum spongiae TaxID=2080658 RepID=A0A2V1GSY8_9GAMM|nr:CPXCG motif-containing cysteine-rich protein [Pelagibaculum spongiae]PVZ66727.1 CPXCG motif-containing cysteine-rich protein [Pelagibaculum spongiae]
MNSLSERSVDCPYCGEKIDVLIDFEDIGNQYVEDCQVCCKPIVFSVSALEDSLEVLVRSEDDA